MCGWRVLALFVFSWLAWFARAGGEGASAWWVPCVRAPLPRGGGFARESFYLNINMVTTAVPSADAGEDEERRKEPFAFSISREVEAEAFRDASRDTRGEHHGRAGACGSTESLRAGGAGTGVGRGATSTAK